MDALFANSPAETKTATEKAFVADFAKQIGDIGAIMMAIAAVVILFILFVAGNTMAQSIRERTNELAMLKTLGFNDGKILGDGAARVVRWSRSLGGALGLALAWVVIAQGDPTGGFLPIFYFPPKDLVLGVVLVLVLGVLSGMVPALQASRLRIVDALREELIDAVPDHCRHRRQPALDPRARSAPRSWPSSASPASSSSSSSVLSIAEGFKAAMTEGRRSAERIIVLRTGSDTEMTSGFSGEDAARIIMDTPGILKGASGPVASAELFVIVNHPLDGDRHRRQRAAARRVDERRSPSARSEDRRRADVRVRAATRSSSDARRRDSSRTCRVGSSVRWGENTWQVVGIFEANGSVAESELWCDARVLQPAYRRGNTYQSVYARLESADAFQAVKDALTADPRLRVTVIREQDYYAGTVAHAADGHPHGRLRHRGADGPRRDLRRGEHDVHRRREPDARDRDAARARLRQLRRS